MKKIFMLAAAVAMLAGCSQDFVEDSNLPLVGDTTTGDVVWYDLGIKLEASVEDVTRLTVDGDPAAATSTMAWETGDLVSVVYDGVVYEYACTNSGRTGVFAPTSQESYIAALDSTKPLAVYYNVKSVDATTQVATFDIPAEQVVGAASNKLPLYSYNAAPALVDNKLPIKMSALASVVEFDLKASSAWNVTSATFAPTTRAAILEAGFVAATDVKVDPTTGAVALADTSVEADTITLALAEMTDVANGLNVQFIVGPAKFRGKSDADGAGVFTGACLKLYKDGNENFRKTMWNTDETLVDLSQGHKHVYQSASDILKGHKDGIRTEEDLWAFREEHQNAVETYPVGTGFCDENGVVYLHADLDVSDKNWQYIGNTGRANLVNLRWRGMFDGQGHTVTYNMTYGWDESAWYAVEANGENTLFSTASAGFFNTICGGYIKNLTVKGNAKILFKQPTSDSHWTYFGSVVGQIHGGVVQNCKSYVKIDATEHYSGKIRCGGITGILKTTTEDAEVLDCENYGDIDIRLKNPTKPQQSIPGGLVGIIGDDSDGYLPYMENCTNYGNVYVDNDFVGNIFMGGCIGVAASKQELSFDLVELYNYGEVKSYSDPAGKQTLYMGGIVGRLQHASLYDCVNGSKSDPELGKVSDTAFTPTSEIAYEANIGGVVGTIDGFSEKALPTLEGCINYAPVSTSGPANTCVGGVVGIQNVTSHVLYCENHGTVTINAPADAVNATFGGGVLGKIGTSKAAYVNRLVAYCENKGDVIISAPANYGNYFGGIVGALYGGTGVPDKTVCGATVRANVNEGNVIVLENGGSALYNRVGGVVGLCNSGSVVENENYGNVEIYSARGQNNSYGGVLGYDNQTEITHEFSDNYNEGTVAVYCDFTPDRETYAKDKWLAVGGVFGQINCKKGTMTVSGNENYGVVAANKGDLVEDNLEYFHIASVVGWWQNVVATLTFEDSVVGGEIGTTSLTGHVAYDPANPDTYKPGTITSTALDNNPESDYYWEKYIFSKVGTTAKTPASSTGHTFGN